MNKDGVEIFRSEPHEGRPDTAQCLIIPTDCVATTSGLITLLVRLPLAPQLGSTATVVTTHIGGLRAREVGEWEMDCGLS